MLEHAVPLSRRKRLFGVALIVLLLIFGSVIGAILPLVTALISKGMLDAAAQGQHPKRKLRRTYPRAVWGRAHSFPSRKDQTQ